MKLQEGSIVKADAGRDSGGYFVVVLTEKDYCYIADGKSRRLQKPKRKNIKHIRATNSMTDINNITDKKLRSLLRTFSEEEE